MTGECVTNKYNKLFLTHKHGDCYLLGQQILYLEKSTNHGESISLISGPCKICVTCVIKHEVCLEIIIQKSYTLWYVDGFTMSVLVKQKNYWSIFVIYNSFWTSLVGWLSQKTSPFWKLWLYFEENFVKYQYFGERVGLGKVWPKWSRP